MSDAWHFHDGKEQVGPFGIAELAATLSTYRNPRSISVWRAGLEDWKRAGDLAELALLLMPLPPSPPPVSPPLRATKDDQLAPKPKSSEAPRPITSTTKHRFNNFIVKNWRGEYSLGITYWVFGLLGNIVAGAIPLIVGAIFLADSSYQPRSIFTVMGTIWLCVFLIAVWQLVAVWRSAGRLIAERTRIGKDAHWAGIARVAVIFGFLRLIAEFGITGLPQLTETWRMAFLNDPSIPDYSMRIMRDGTEVEIAGGIKFGLTDDFIKLLRASPQIKVVHLNSIGGRIGEAESLYKTIRDNGLITYTSSRCLSACTLAFAAGRERWIHQRAELGFHSPSFPGMSDSELQDMAQSQKDIFARAGFNSRFADRAMSTPNKDMWTPSLDELRRANVVTAVSDGSDFAASGFGSGVTKETMSSMLTKKLPVFQTLKVTMPAQFDLLLEAYYRSYLAGRTETEMVEAARSKFLPVLAALRPLADGDVLVELGRLYADQYEAVGTADPAACYKLASGVGASSDISRVPANLFQREVVLNERVIATATERAPVSEQMTTGIWNKVSRQLAAKGYGPSKIEMLQSTNLEGSRHAEYCRIAVAYMREIANLPASEGALLFREFWSTK
jgi:ATP-dependent protease ClpP protease subunit